MVKGGGTQTVPLTAKTVDRPYLKTLIQTKEKTGVLTNQIKDKKKTERNKGNLINNVVFPSVSSLCSFKYTPN